MFQLPLMAMELDAFDEITMQVLEIDGGDDVNIHNMSQIPIPIISNSRQPPEIVSSRMKARGLGSPSPSLPESVSPPVVEISPPAPILPVTIPPISPPASVQP